MADTVELGWTICELLGHRVIAGFVSEVEIAGAGFLRVDLWAPDGEKRTTQFVSPSSVYALTPTTEEAVRERMQPRPVLRLAPAFVSVDNPWTHGLNEEEEDAEEPEF
jgi:hypothetical protein